MHWNIYLSGEIHTDWREQIIKGCEALDLPVSFSSANTDHDSSDAAGDVLGPQCEGFWRDHKSAKINAIRIKTLIENCDMAVIRFAIRFRAELTFALTLPFRIVNTCPVLLLAD